MSRARGDGGQSSLLAIAVVLVVAAVCGALVELGAELTVRGRAQAVADLVALAATWGEEPAEQVARRNGAELVSLVTSGDRAEATVELDGRRAVAAATR